MRAILIPILFAIAGCVSAPQPSPCPNYPAPAAPEYGPSIVVKLTRKETGRTIFFNSKDFTKKPNEYVSPSAKVLAAIGADKAEQIPGINGYILSPPKGVKVNFNQAALELGWVSQPEYEYSVKQEVLYRIVPTSCPNQPAPSPSPTPSPTPAPADKSWGLSAVRAAQARALVSGKAKVGVLDTGIDLGNPCNGPIFYQKDYSGKGSVQDGNGHGTHVAGTIGGSCGIGVATGLVEFAIGKALSDSGSGTTGALASGMVDLCNQGIIALNNSWGGGGSDPMLNQATDYCVSKNVTVIFAAGNDGGPVNNPAKQAGTKKPKVRAVSCSTSNGQVCSFSSRGPETTDIAPGAGIISAWPRGKACHSGRSDGLCSLDGTSMSTPHVVGICALGSLAGKVPCIKHNGVIGGYPRSDALAAVQ